MIAGVNTERGKFIHNISVYNSLTWINCIFTVAYMAPEELGNRLHELRKALTRDSGEEWTQPKIGQAVGLSQNAIHRLEYGTGSIVNLSLILDFYHNKGYNVQWVMALDNHSIGMYREDKLPDRELKQALETLNRIIHNKFS